MYYAKQVNPEYQEDNLFYTYKDKNGKYHLGWNDEVYEKNVIIYGNKDYHNSTIKEFDNLLKIEDSIYEYELLLNKNTNHCYWDNVSQFINYYLPKSNGKKYSMKEIHEWKILLEEYWKIDEIAEKALRLMTDKNWRRFRMSGCCQRDWQYGFASDEITNGDIEYIEMCYFNTGSQYLFYESEDDYNNDSPTTEYYVRDEDELIKHVGCKRNEIKIYNFAGYKKIPTYELYDE